MNNKRDSVPLSAYAGKSAFEQFLLATNGKSVIHEKAMSWMFFVDQIAHDEKNNLVPDSDRGAYRLHHEDIGKSFIEFWWEAKQSKNGDAFRQMATMAEKTIASAPDYQFVANFIKLPIEKGKLRCAPPIVEAVRIFNKTYAVNTGIPKTSYQQIKRIYKVLNVNPPPAKRGPRPKTNPKSLRKGS